MKVLVTGATGGVGSHTAAALCRDGHDVRLLVRRPDRVARVPALRGLTGIDVVAGDVTDRASVERALEGCDAVVHAAALVTLDDRRAEEARSVNVEGTRNVVGGAVRAGASRVVHVSSVSLFGTGGTTVTVDSPLVEGGGGYAESKRSAELVVRELQAEGAPVAITYPSGVYGPSSPHATITDQALGFWLAAAPRTSGGTSIVDVRDVAQAHTALLARPPGPSRWILGGHFLSWEEAWRVLEEVTGRRIPFVPMPGPALRIAGRVGDVVKRAVPFDFPLTREAMESATRAAPYDSTPAVEELGIGFGPCGTRWPTPSGGWPSRAGCLPRSPGGSLPGSRARQGQGRESSATRRRGPRGGR